MGINKRFRIFAAENIISNLSFQAKNVEVLERERTNAKPSYHVLIWGIHICSFRFSTLYQLGKYGFPIFMSGKLETNKISKSKEALLRSCVQMLSVKLWDDISINDIEKFIQKTRGAIFHHYKTKDELFYSALTFFIAKSNLRILNETESICQSFIKTLKDDFDVQAPEKAFISLLIQCRYKGIDLDPNPFLEILPENVKREELDLGEIFLHAFTE